MPQVSINKTSEKPFIARPTYQVLSESSSQPTGAEGILVVGLRSLVERWRERVFWVWQQCDVFCTFYVSLFELVTISIEKIIGYIWTIINKKKSHNTLVLEMPYGPLFQLSQSVAVFFVCLPNNYWFVCCLGSDRQSVFTIWILPL